MDLSYRLIKSLLKIASSLSYLKNLDISILSEDEKIGLAYRQDIPLNIVETLSGDKNPKVRKALALNSHIPNGDRIYRILMLDDNTLVRMALVTNEAIPLDVLRFLASDENSHVNKFARNRLQKIKPPIKAPQKQYASYKYAELLEALHLPTNNIFILDLSLQKQVNNRLVYLVPFEQTHAKLKLSSPDTQIGNKQYTYMNAHDFDLKDSYHGDNTPFFSYEIDDIIVIMRSSFPYEKGLENALKILQDYNNQVYKKEQIEVSPMRENQVNFYTRTVPSDIISPDPSKLTSDFNAYIYDRTSNFLEEVRQ